MIAICFQNQTNEINKEFRVKERLEEELKELYTNIKEKSAEVTNLKHQLGQAQHNVGKLEANVKDLKVLNEKETRNKTKCTIIIM
jgi:archaellum component FlaC